MMPSEEFEQAIEALLEDRSPREVASRLDADEQRMLRMAQLLRGSHGQQVRPEFAEQLQETILARPRRVSRRTAFLSGVGALAAGVLAGVGIDRATRPSSSQPQLSLEHGRWFRVAHVAELPPGAVRSFQAGAVQGFLINHGGQVRAVSRICTHMACVLNFSKGDQAIVCPCHGAQFDLRGQLLSGPGGGPYAVSIPPLPRIETRVNGEAIEVWSV